MIALLVIDMQVGSTDDSPRLDLDGVTQRINRLAQATRESDGLVIFIQHDGSNWHLTRFGDFGANPLISLSMKMDIDS